MDSTTNLSYNQRSSKRCAICKVSIKSLFASIAPVNFLSSKPAEDFFYFAALIDCKRWHFPTPASLLSDLFSCLWIHVMKASQGFVSLGWTLSVWLFIRSSANNIRRWCIGTHSTIMLIKLLNEFKTKKEGKEFSFTSNYCFNVHCIMLQRDMLA